jgi:hypothetical protein
VTASPGVAAAEGDVLAPGIGEAGLHQLPDVQQLDVISRTERWSAVGFGT